MKAVFCTYLLNNTSFSWISNLGEPVFDPGKVPESPKAPNISMYY